MQKEWSFFFDQIAKAFTGKCSRYDAITSITCQIGYSLLTNKVIDIAKSVIAANGPKDESMWKLGGQRYTITGFL